MRGVGVLPITRRCALFVEHALSYRARPTPVLSAAALFSVRRGGWYRNAPPGACYATETPRRERAHVSFFKFSPVPCTKTLSAAVRSLLAQYDALGRVRVGRDGVNGQVVVDHDAVEAVQKGLESIKELSGGITLSVEPPLPVPKPQCADEESALQHMPRYWVPEKYKKHRARITQRSVAFDSLSVSAKSSIINLSGKQDEQLPVDECGEFVEPAQWHAMLDGNQKGERDPLILDVRNDYEAAVGKFEGAIPVGTDVYSQTQSALDTLLRDVETDRDVMLYCTGGIRCVRVGAYLKQRGYENVHQLKGGILGYARYVHDENKKSELSNGEEGAARANELESKFKGSCFVFDNRYAVKVTDDVLGKCAHCGTPCELFQHCAYPPCNLLFVQCESCTAATKSCCSPQCHDALLADEDPHCDHNRKTYRRMKTQSSVSEFEKSEKAAVSKQNSLTYAYGYSTSYRNEDLLGEMRAYALKAFPRRAHAASRPEMLHCLSIMIEMRKATRVLELGTFVGLGTVAMAEGVASSCDKLGVRGSVDSLEKDRALAEAARQFISRSTVSDVVEIHTVDAMDFIQARDASDPPYDFVFLDADKRRYTRYFEVLLESGAVQSGSVIVADNVLFRDMVANRESLRGEYDYARYERIVDALHEFNEAVLRDNRTRQGVLPLGAEFDPIDGV